MAETRRFSSHDIGAGLLQIITTGLYRDPLDTLREYIQNAIDAGARNIELVIDNDVISVRDDGCGMPREIADKAMRLGISDKNPTQDVGFRGIGIYSAFNTCDRLEIHTRPAHGAASLIVFDFGHMRRLLAEETQRRLDRNPPELYLEKLLAGAVSVADDPETPIAAAGTVVMMVGVGGDVSNRLTDKKAVKDYLENVVPLPFHPEFHHKGQIEAKFQQEDYRCVHLMLQMDARPEQLYRPYRNAMFSHEGGYGPKFYKLGNVLSGGNLGFAWVCLNDARKYLPDKLLRGLLIKKFDFSVGGRDQFARFFGRAVFNHRVTGEIIVTHRGLIPNAARTDFEPGPARDGLYLALDQLASQISSWAETVQNELKAREELETISPRIFEVVKEIPAVERDVPELLRLNTELSSYANTLKHHKAILQKLDKVLFDKTLAALGQAADGIKQILSSPEKRAKTRGGRIVQAMRMEAKAPTKEELPFARDKPQNLADVMTAADLEASPGTRLMLDYLDREILRERLSSKEYAEFIEGLVEYLNENL